MEGREPDRCPGAPDRLRFAIVHYHAMVEELGEKRAVPQMRKHLGLLSQRHFTARVALRERLMRTETAAETLGIVAETIATLEAPDVASSPSRNGRRRAAAGALR